MHAPDKPAFLVGSDQATPFLSLPFCPGQMNDEMSERHLSASDKIAIPQLSPTPSSLGIAGAAANNKLKVGAHYAMDGPAFKISPSVDG